ncbi:SLFN8 protein, partial [Psilopogon haemacephalus]|nr:SLFN8 protein [Psilopogon haemacephalus]
MYPPHYGMVSNGNLRDLLRALTVALLTFKSFLSDRVGYEFLNLLTFKQYELLSENLHRTKKLYVYGLPGTGKTVLAMKIMEKIRIMLQCSQEEVLYICETKGLRDFVQEENICQAATRVEFLQGSFGEVKHIIIDEAQSFRDEEGDWYEKAMRLTSSPDLPEPGFLWIFLDYLQTCHNFPTGLPDAGRHDPVESLTQVVRSSNSVYGYVRNTMKNVVEGYAQGIPLQRLKRLVERATCAHPVKGKLEIRMMESGEIIKYVVEHCREYSRNGHSCTDLAVLFYEHEGVFTEYCKSCLEGELQTSSRIPFKRMDNSSWRECAVVDSIQNFAGLERSIVFGILPVSVQKLEHLLTTGLVWIASRATLHLHVLFEAEPK